MGVAGKRRKRTVGDYVLLGFLCAAVLLVSSIPVLVPALKERGERERVKEVTAAVEELLPKVPKVKQFVAENLECLAEAEGIFDKYDVQRVSGTGEHILIRLADSGESAALAEAELLTEEEKEKIAALFADDGPLREYDVVFRLDPEEYSARERAKIHIVHLGMEDAEVEHNAELTFYMEEVENGWYVAIDPEGIADRAMKDLRAYDKYVKSQREDGGLVRLEDENGL